MYLKPNSVVCDWIILVLYFSRILTNRPTILQVAHVYHGSIQHSLSEYS